MLFISYSDLLREKASKSGGQRSQMNPTMDSERPSFQAPAASVPAGHCQSSHFRTSSNRTKTSWKLRELFKNSCLPFHRPSTLKDFRKKEYQEKEIPDDRTVQSSAPQTPAARQLTFLDGLDSALETERMKVEQTHARGMGMDMRGKVVSQPYHWPHDASLSRGNTALVIIDMQRDCTCAVSFVCCRIILILSSFPLVACQVRTNIFLAMLSLKPDTNWSHCYPHLPDYSQLPPRK